MISSVYRFARNVGVYNHSPALKTMTLPSQKWLIGSDATTLLAKFDTQDQGQVPHPADTMRWYNAYRLSDADPVNNILLTGDDAVRVLAWNPTQVALGWDQWVLLHEMKYPSTEDPFTKYVVDAQRREPCIEEEVPASAGDSTATALDIGLAQTTIPLQITDGDTTRFDVQPDGSLNLLLTPKLGYDFGANVRFDFVMNQNTDETILLQWIYTGAGFSLTVPSAFPFQTSRGDTFPVTMKADLFIGNDVQVGDNVKLVANRLQSQTVLMIAAQWASPEALVNTP